MGWSLTPPPATHPPTQTKWRLDPNRHLQIIIIKKGQPQFFFITRSDRADRRNPIIVRSRFSYIFFSLVRARYFALGLDQKKKAKPQLSFNKMVAMETARSILQNRNRSEKKTNKKESQSKEKLVNEIIFPPISHSIRRRASFSFASTPKVSRMGGGGFYLGRPPPTSATPGVAPSGRRR